MCRRDGGVCKSRNREKSKQTSAVIEVRVDGDVHQVTAIKMVGCGQTDCGYILKTELTGVAGKLNVQCEQLE